MKSAQTETNKHRINLNQLTICERLLFPETFDKYKEEVILLLQLKKMFLSKEDVLKNFSSSQRLNTKSANINAILTQILEETPDLIAFNRPVKKGKGITYHYLDLASSYYIAKEDVLFDSFFIRWLRSIDLLEVAGFLDYQLKASFENDFQNFAMFIKICLRKHQDKKLSVGLAETINDWLDSKTKGNKTLDGVPETEKIKTDPIKRQAKDNKTVLNQEQTVLLLHYLQQQRYFLRDEYLTNVDAGMAYEILTGYSATTTRQNLGKINQSKTLANLKAVDNFLTGLKLNIDKAIKENRKPE